MAKPRQRESLFGSEAEKDAAIRDYEVFEASLRKTIDRTERQLFNLKAQREAVTRRIQELQNLNIFKGQEENK